MCVADCWRAVRSREVAVPVRSRMSGVRLVLCIMTTSSSSSEKSENELRCMRIRSLVLVLRAILREPVPSQGVTRDG